MEIDYSPPGILRECSHEYLTEIQSNEFKAK